MPYPNANDLITAIGFDQVGDEMRAQAFVCATASEQHYRDNADSSLLDDPPANAVMAMTLYAARLFAQLSGGINGVQVGDASVSISDIDPMLASLEADLYNWPDPFPTSTS